MIQVMREQDKSPEEELSELETGKEPKHESRVVIIRRSKNSGEK